MLLDSKKTESGKVIQDRWSYDGEKIINLRTIPALPAQGGFSSADNLSRFSNPWIPVVLAGLFDSKSCNVPAPLLDIVMYLDGDLGQGTLTGPDGKKIDTSPPTFEKIEILDGRECIAVSDTVHSKYFDIGRDFSLVQSDTFDLVTSDLPQGRVLTGRTLSSRMKFFDMKNYGNGIWMPSRIETSYFDNKGGVIRQDKITVTSLNINKGIEDTYFTDFIPDDALMSDAISNMVYKYGDHASIGDLLKETAKSKRVFIYRYISVISGLALIVIVLAMKYRQYRKNKRDSENKTEKKK
ncbi:hypothetical protein FACS1894170_13480 [Planctomycetales bacterium]|nr:hypothetical protein FACS1894170_13480 [Planctomycetales bacterium]